jgi:hypothetical protein
MPAQQTTGTKFIPPASDQAYYQLKSRQKELNAQLEEVNDRRDDLTRELTNGNTRGADAAGIERRLQVVDATIIQLETDLATVGKELAAARPASLEYPEPQTFYRGYGDEDMVGAGFIGAGIMFTLFIPLLYRNFRRRRSGSGNSPTIQTPAINNERVDRMEAAIDSIAVEIERVSENQRFMTRLMTETQLAGTIAAVRGSTEAAKAAADKASNA